MASKANKATNTAGLSVREVDILCAVHQSFKSRPEVRSNLQPSLLTLDKMHSLTHRTKIDMQKFATLAGFGTNGSAKTMMYRVLKKSQWRWAHFA